GATFSVSLPMLADSAAHVADVAAATSAALPRVPKFPSLDGLKVLLVEDERDVREVLAILLERCGASVQTAASAREALASYRTEPPDILVTDIGMPLEDGYDLLTKVRALKAGPRPHVPAIALTGYARTEDRA